MRGTNRSVEQASDLVKAINHFITRPGQVIKTNVPSIWSGYQTLEYRPLTLYLQDRNLLNRNEIVGVSGSCIDPRKLSVLVGQPIEKKEGGFFDRLEKIARRRSKASVINSTTSWLVALYENNVLEGGILKLEDEYSIKRDLSIIKLDRSPLVSLDEHRAMEYDPTADPWANRRGNWYSFLGQRA